MPSLDYYEAPHCTVPARALKLVVLGLLAATAWAQTTHPAGHAALRDELIGLVRAGKSEEAVRRAQQAVRDHPGDPGVRQEYVDLHLALAHSWLAQRRFDDCTVALEAIRAVEPEHAEARFMLRELHGARERAGREVPEIDRLLRLELFEAALERVQQTKLLRPDLADELAEREQAAWLGAADDHYLARNFSEAFALYESVLAGNPEASEAVRTRWAVSLLLALGESDLSAPIDPNAAGRLLARVVDVLRRTRQAVLGQIIGGLLAERAGQLAEAGRTYSEALGLPWELPPADERRARVRELGQQAMSRAKALYADTPVNRRTGFWAVAPPEVWKPRQTPHFEVYARNDLVAERVAEAAEYHLAGTAGWLGRSVPEGWEPRCEIRVHATQEELHGATRTRGVTFAVSHTRLQGDEVLSRKLEVFQADPWLVSSTLPHELTHLLIAEACRPGGLPLAIDEGLALRAEPPARRLMYWRLLEPEPAGPGELLAMRQLPDDVQGFYARAGALAAWLLSRVSQQLSDASESSAPAGLLESLRNGVSGDWWRGFGLDSEAAMNRAWSAWYSALRSSPRMPLVIRVEPSGEHRQRPKQ